MRRVRLLALAGAAAATLSACSPPEPSHDVAYYRSEPAARAAEIQACRTDRGRRVPTANCINALAADSGGVSNRFWTTRAPVPRVAKPGSL